MSSHHIVREKQEPALLIMNMDGFNHENLGQLLEWSPTVIVDAAMFELVDSLGIKIDGIVTASSAISSQPETILIHTKDNPLQDALKYLTGEQFPAVNIIDESFQAKDYALYVERIDIVVLTPERKIYPVKPGFSKWQTAGEEIEILLEATNLHYSGLIPITEHIFETEKEGFYTLTFDQPFTFIAERL
jgi:thiamine pyrophosphokinase